MRRQDPHGCPTTVRTARMIASAGLAGVGVVHALWAVGADWPARTRRGLAEAVVGSETMPGPVACAVVAGGALAASTVVAGAGGEARAARGVRLAVGAGLVARAGVGGVVAARLLALPTPGAQFRRLDARWYRPLCAVLGGLVILSTGPHSRARARARGER